MKRKKKQKNQKNKKKKTKKNDKKSYGRNRTIWELTIRELTIDTIEHDYEKLINDLDIEKGFEMEKKKKIETKLEKSKLSKTIADTIKKSVF